VRATLVGLLRFVSIGVCLIVVASFATFAIVQTKTASGHQQEELAATPAESAAAIAANKTGHEGGVHKALDEASRELTSPFAGIVSGSSEWATRGVKLALTLLVYGFGLGYLARTLRVRL
jgi:opacity protein-like surface antigen